MPACPPARLFLRVNHVPAGPTAPPPTLQTALLVAAALAGGFAHVVVVFGGVSTLELETSVSRTLDAVACAAASRAKAAEAAAALKALEERRLQLSAEAGPSQTGGACAAAAAEAAAPGLAAPTDAELALAQAAADATAAEAAAEFKRSVEVPLEGTVLGSMLAEPTVQSRLAGRVSMVVKSHPVGMSHPAKHYQVGRRCGKLHDVHCRHWMCCCVESRCTRLGHAAAGRAYLPQPCNKPMHSCATL